MESMVLVSLVMYNPYMVPTIRAHPLFVVERECKSTSVCGPSITFYPPPKPSFHLDCPLHIFVVNEDEISLVNCIVFVPTLLTIEKMQIWKNFSASAVIRVKNICNHPRLMFDTSIPGNCNVSPPIFCTGIGIT